MKSVRRLRTAARPTSLDARFHGHDVIPAQAEIQGFAQILDMNQVFLNPRPFCPLILFTRGR
jgi:hypothetical protein